MDTLGTPRVALHAIDVLGWLDEGLPANADLVLQHASEIIKKSPHKDEHMAHILRFVWRATQASPYFSLDSEKLGTQNFRSHVYSMH
jgi:hypothetical protein